MTNRKDPLDPFSDGPITGYPLTEGDLWILANGWWDEFYSVVSSSILYGQIGRTERSRHRYIVARLELLEERLGPDEFARIGSLAELRLREGLGEELWAAYVQDRPILWERITTDLEAGTRPGNRPQPKLTRLK